MNLDRLEWHYVSVGSYPAYVLTYGKRWFAMLYYHYGYRIRVWDLPSWDFKDYGEHEIPSVEVPKGFKDGMTYSSSGLATHIYWLLKTLQLPEKFRFLPMERTRLSQVPFVDKRYVRLNGCRLALSLGRKSLPEVMQKPVNDHTRSLRYELNRPKPKTWDQRYPSRKDELQGCLSSKAADFKGVYGQRVALKWDKAGMRAFCKLRGSPLSIEWEEIFWSGGKKLVFLLGFNYGQD